MLSFIRTKNRLPAADLRVLARFANRKFAICDFVECERDGELVQEFLTIGGNAVESWPDWWVDLDELSWIKTENQLPRADQHVLGHFSLHDFAICDFVEYERDGEFVRQFLTDGNAVESWPERWADLSD